MASIFTPSEGTAHECKTSSAVTRIRACVCMGINIRESTSNSRKLPGSRF